MPRTSSARSTKSRNSRSNSSKRRTPAKKSSSRQPVERLSPEVKIDIGGGLLAVFGVISLLGFLTGQKGMISGWSSHILQKAAGWGGVVLPLIFLACGLWLLFRNVERFPRLSTGRVVGIALLYLNLLSWFHFFEGGGYLSANLGEGGGYVGAFFIEVLSKALGQMGAVVFLIAWALIAFVFMLDLSLPELADKLAKLFEQPKKVKPIQSQPAPVVLSQPQKQTSWSVPQELPEGFNPLNLHDDQ